MTTMLPSGCLCFLLNCNMNLNYHEPYLADPPGPPENPQITEVFKDHVTLTWQPPAFDGGSEVTGYYVERAVSTSTRWLKVTKEAISELTFTDKEVIEDNEYKYQISAENKVGVGPPASPSDSVTVKDPWSKFTKSSLILNLILNSHSNFLYQ